MNRLRGACEGTHRLNLAGGHLKVTGVPFSIGSKTNANTSIRSFLDDPADRELQHLAQRDELHPRCAQRGRAARPEE